MSLITTPDAMLTAIALNRLEKFPANTYIIATGHDKLFYATPSGYAAIGLPVHVLADVTEGLVKKIVWASFGSEIDSWFFALEMRDGTKAFKIGDGIPSALRQFMTELKKHQIPLDTLRVQLGDKESFVVWLLTSWASANVPVGLLNQLRRLSSFSTSSKDYTEGSLKISPLENVQWHPEGSWFISCGGLPMGVFVSNPARFQWSKFWKDGVDEDSKSKIQKELAYVYLDPHASTAHAFAYIKKEEFATDAGYYFVHFGYETMFPGQQSDNVPVPASSMQQLPQAPGDTIHFQWATCIKSGRARAKDSWDLEVKKGDRVKVLRDMGRGWYLVEGKVKNKNIKGWVHDSWLNFGDRTLQTDAKRAYAKFQHDMLTTFVPGQLSSFPVMSRYMDSCTKVECQLLREKPAALSICVHDLMLLLEGSACYSYKWLKDGRNLWHPDRFAGFCRPEHAGNLKALAEQMFVLYGVLMETFPRASRL